MVNRIWDLTTSQNPANSATDDFLDGDEREEMAAWMQIFPER